MDQPGGQLLPRDRASFVMDARTIHRAACNARDAEFDYLVDAVLACHKEMNRSDRAHFARLANLVRRTDNAQHRSHPTHAARLEESGDCREVQFKPTDHLPHQEPRAEIRRVRAHHAERLGTIVVRFALSCHDVERTTGGGASPRQRGVVYLDRVVS